MNLLKEIWSLWELLLLFAVVSWLNLPKIILGAFIAFLGYRIKPTHKQAEQGVEHNSTTIKTSNMTVNLKGTLKYALVVMGIIICIGSVVQGIIESSSQGLTRKSEERMHSIEWYTSPNNDRLIAEDRIISRNKYLFIADSTDVFNKAKNKIDSARKAGSNVDSIFVMADARVLQMKRRARLLDKLKELGQ